MEPIRSKNILTLPTELQIKILSCLNFETQLIACTVCPLWSEILTKSPSLIGERYTSELVYSSRSGIKNSTLSRGGKLGWIHRIFDSTRNDSVFEVTVDLATKRLKWSFRTPGMNEVLDISDHPFLDDLVFGYELVTPEQSKELERKLSVKRKRDDPAYLTIRGFEMEATIPGDKASTHISVSISLHIMTTKPRLARAFGERYNSIVDLGSFGDREQYGNEAITIKSMFYLFVIKIQDKIEDSEKLYNWDSSEHHRNESNLCVERWLRLRIAPLFLSGRNNIWTIFANGSYVAGNKETPCVYQKEAED